MKVYVAKASYDDPQEMTHTGIVGVFSSEKRAQAGLDSFVEGVLEMEFSGYRNFSSEILRFELDHEWLDGGGGVF